MAACKSNSAKTARDYNNNIIAQETILLPEATATDSKVARFYEAGEYDSYCSSGRKKWKVWCKRVLMTLMPCLFLKQKGYRI
jgi:hypothetical protein